MRKTFFLILLLPLLALCCNKDPEPVDPIDKLPAATQTGANTFGCLVDGELYLPKGAGNVSALSMSYGGGHYQLQPIIQKLAKILVLVFMVLSTNLKIFY